MSTKALFWALKAEVGNPHQKLILITLADIANEAGQCWPSHTYIATRAECSRRTVMRHLSALEALGLIKITGRVDADGLKSSNIYTICSPDVSESHIADVSESHKGSVTESHKPPIDTPIYINGDAWQEWLEYKKQARHKKMTPATCKKQWSLLADYDFATQQRIIDASIQNGWQGLFAPKPQGGDRGGGKSTRHSDIHDDLTDTSWAH